MSRVETRLEKLEAAYVGAVPAPAGPIPDDPIDRKLYAFAALYDYRREVNHCVEIDYERFERAMNRAAAGELTEAEQEEIDRLNAAMTEYERSLCFDDKAFNEWVRQVSEWVQVTGNELVVPEDLIEPPSAEPSVFGLLAHRVWQLCGFGWSDCDNAVHATACNYCYWLSLADALIRYRRRIGPSWEGQSLSSWLGFEL